jgi:hypothetical protein
MTDAWGDSIIYNRDSLNIASRRGTSFLQPDSWIVLKLARNSNALFQNTVRGIVYDAKGNVPGDQDTANLKVVLTWPLNGHQFTDTAREMSNGNFQFLQRVTTGNQRLAVQWIYPGPPPETTRVVRNVSVAPGGLNWIEVHLPVPFR